MYIKNGVILKNINACVIPALLVCCEYFNSIRKELVLTSGNEGKHKVGSKHYSGDAFDIRSRDMSGKEVQDLVTYFRARIDTCYDIVIESDHVHIEYDDHALIVPFP